LYHGKRGGRRRVWERGRGGALTVVEVVAIGEVVGEVVAIKEREREGIEAGVDVYSVAAWSTSTATVRSISAAVARSTSSGKKS
jgi:hypothetical protein